MRASKHTFIPLVIVLTACTELFSNPDQPIPPVTLTLPSHPSLPLQARWQIQYTGVLQTNLDVEVFNLDLFETPTQTIAALHKRNIFVMCYLSAGSYEDWRPDAHAFPYEVLGNALEEWPGEQWLDIRRLDILQPIMEARLDLAVQKGCDGVDPDNVNGYTNPTGFPLSAEDQKRYNLFWPRPLIGEGFWSV